MASVPALDASAAINVTKVAAGIEAIAHPLLERLGVGEAAIGLTLPDRRAVVEGWPFSS